MKADMICIASRAKTKDKDIHDIHKGIALRQSWKSRRFHSLVHPKYNLIEDLVHHILRRCDVDNGLHHDDKLLKQILMLLRAIVHWKTSLHGVELIPSLDLCRSQRHRCTTTNTVEGDLLNVGRNIIEASIDEGTPGIYDIHGCVHCQLERLQLHCQG